MKTILGALLTLLLVDSASAAVERDAAPLPGDRPAGYLSVSIDRVVVDSAGLAAASATLAASIDRFALAVREMAADGGAISEEDKKMLLRAVQSAATASDALTQLAQQLPQAAQTMGDRLPRVIADAGQPIADLASGLESARSSISMITEALPQATENTRKLVDASLDAALQRLVFYSIVLVALLALAVIGIMWFVYRQYIQPLTRRLDELAGAPGHFDNMARYMSETSANLLQVQNGALRRAPRGSASYRRQ